MLWYFLEWPIRIANNFWINELSAFYYFVLFVYFIFLFFSSCKDGDIVGCQNIQNVRFKGSKISKFYKA